MSDEEKFGVLLKIRLRKDEAELLDADLMMAKSSTAGAGNCLVGPDC